MDSTYHEFKKGDRVTVRVGVRQPFHGTVTGMSRNGAWVNVIKDGTKSVNGYALAFCRPLTADNTPISDPTARLQELRKLVQEYYEHYMQDEAEEIDVCVDDRQHVLAVAIRDVLNELQADSSR